MTRLVVISHACVTPVNRRVFEQLRRSTGWDVTLIVPDRWNNDYGAIRTSAQTNDFHGPVECLPMIWPGSVPLHAYGTVFPERFAKLKADLVYIQNEPYSLSAWQAALPWFRARRPALGFYAAQNLYKKYPLPIRLFERMVFRRADFATPITNDVEAVLRRRGYRGASTVIPLGVDFDLYGTAGAESVQALRRPLVAPDEPLLGYVGRFAEEKGLETLLHALARISTLPWKLVLVGGGATEGRLRILAKELGLDTRISWQGYVPHDQVHQYLSAFDLLVLPSETHAHWKEQFGRVIVEALACGTAVVGSDSGAIPEVLHATGGGLIFPEGQAGALSDQLRRVLSDHTLRTELAETGRNRARQLYSQDSVAAALARAMQKALSATNQQRRHTDARDAGA